MRKENHKKIMEVANYLTSLEISKEKMKEKSKTINEKKKDENIQNLHSLKEIEASASQELKNLSMLLSQKTKEFIAKPEAEIEYKKETSDDQESTEKTELEKELESKTIEENEA